MSETKRINELDDTSQVSDIYLIGDSAELDSAVRVYSSNFTFDIEVSTLPTADISIDATYYLTEADGNAPSGHYVNNGNGWRCFTQLFDISLDDWSGDVTEELYSGVAYTVEVVGDVTSLNISTTSTGSVIIIIDNSSGSYTISNPSGDNSYMRSDNGLTDLSADLSEFAILNNNTNMIYSAVGLISIYVEPDISSGAYALVSDGAQYIDTGVIFDDTYSFSINTAFVGTDVGYFLGSIGDTLNITAQTTADTFYFTYGTEDNIGTTSYTSDVYYTFDLIDKEFSVDSVSSGTSTSSLSGLAYSFVIFGVNDSGVSEGQIGTKMTTCEIWSDVELTSKLIDMWAVPSGRTASGASTACTANCMYDSVSDTYYYNEGTGEFTIEAYGSETERLYYGNYEDSILYEIDPDTLLIINTSETIAGTLSGVGGITDRLYYCSIYDGIYEIDPDTLIQINSNDDATLNYSGLGGTADRLYYTYYDSTESCSVLVELDADTLTAINTVYLESTAYIDGIGGIADRLYCVDSDGCAFLEIDPDTLLTINTVSSDREKLGGIGGMTSRLYAGDWVDVVIFELDPDTLLELSNSIVLGTDIWSIGGTK